MFYSHSVNHPHGWGLMRFSDEEREIFKEPVCASNSIVLHDIIKSTQPLDSDWTDYPVCTLRAYKNGKLLFESKEKTTEFVPTLEYISSMASLNI